MPLTSCSIPRRLSLVKEAVWLFTPIFSGSTRLLESQLTERPWMEAEQPRVQGRRRVLPPGSGRAWKGSTHRCVHAGQVQQLVPAFACGGQSDGEVQEADGENTCGHL